MKKNLFYFLLCSFFLCLTFIAKADDGPTLVNVINNYGTGGGTGGALSATFNDGTVTVTNTGATPITDVTQTLSLNINAGVTVLWNASVTGTAATASQSLVNLTGTGVFEVASGEIVQTGANRAIYNGNAGTVIVSGGLVSSACNNNNGTIDCRDSNTNTSPRIIIRGGIVECTSSTAQEASVIYQGSNFGAVVVEGGTLRNTGTGGVIHANLKGLVTISETDPQNHPTLLTCNGTNQWRGAAIYLQGQGDLTTRLIVEGGTIENNSMDINSKTIRFDGGTAGTISGGTIRANKGVAVHGNGGFFGSPGTVIEISEANSEVPTIITSAADNVNNAAVFFEGDILNISGGIIENINNSTNSYALRINGEGKLTVSGGIMRATTGTALYSNSSSAGQVEIIGGLTSATTGFAIFFNNINASLTLNGGTAFAYGTALNNVISKSNFSGPTGNGIVMAWDNSSGANEYFLGSSGDIFSMPENAGAWAIVAETTGISYANDTNTGFIEISGITITDVSVPPIITTETLPNGMKNMPYSQTLAATGTSPITWVVTAGDLPDGLTLSPAGVISGTPTVATTFGFTVKATNFAGEETTKPFSIIIEAPVPPEITITELPDGVVNVYYYETLTATGTAPIIWTLVEGDLPNGLLLAPNTGSIFGTPTTPGTFNFTLKASNISEVDDEQELSITVIVMLPEVTTILLPKGSINSPYSANLTAAGTTPITWELADGNLPTGLSIAANGAIFGTATELGAFTFTVKATNIGGSGTKELSIDIIECAIENLANAINVYGTGGGTGGALEAVWDEETATITVINADNTPLTGVTQTLSLNIENCAKLIWNASLTGSAAATNQALINLTGEGVFEVTGGLISQTSDYNRAIHNANTGIVNVTGGEVSATTGVAIWNNSNGVITVSGTALITSACSNGGQGTVNLFNNGVSDNRPRLIVSGGTIINAANNTESAAVYNATAGAINISGGTIKATGTGCALKSFSLGLISISEPDKGNYPTLLSSQNATDNRATVFFEIVGNTLAERLILTGGTIENTSDNTISRAIRFYDYVGINIQGGTIKANKGAAIYTRSNNSILISEANSAVQPTIITSDCENQGVGTIYFESNTPLDITGGTVTNITNNVNGVAIRNNNGGKISILGGVVSITNGTAIYNNSGSPVEISGGLVRATTGWALFANNINAVFTVNGKGTAFAYGTSKNNVISHSGFSGPTGDGAVIAWDQSAGVTEYDVNTDDDIFSMPETIATWSLIGDRVGIGYVNGANTGFIDIPEVTVKAVPVITTTQMPNGAMGLEYIQMINATGTKPIIFTLEDGALPTGLELEEDGTISGTPTAVNTFSFTVKATNIAGEAIQELSITILADAVPPAVTSETLQDGVIYTSYSETLSATGTVTIIWSLEEGDLPTGLNISPTGVISGTPTAAGTFAFTVKAENGVGSDTKELAITILVPPVITTTTLPAGAISVAYSQTLAATGSTPMTWAILDGDLPTGLSILPEGIISGTPMEEGLFAFTVEVTNSVGSDTKGLSIRINILPEITTTELLEGNVNTAYSQTLTVTGTMPITWAMASGALPDGLTLSPAGVISGMPTADGEFDFTVKATNVAGTDTKPLSITIGTTVIAPEIITTTLPSGLINVTYVQTITAGGTIPIEWSVVNGNLPTGLDILPSGAISGIPTASGSFSFTVRAENSAGFDEVEFNIVIASCALSSTVNAINTYGTGGGSGGALNAVWEAETGTVIVTNTGGIPITGANQQLSLNIEQCATVLWNASLSGATTSVWSRLVQVSGTGTFEVPEGGLISQTGNSMDKLALSNQGTGTIIISGGTVKATEGPAILNDAAGLIKISGNSLVTSACTNMQYGTICMFNGSSANTEDRLIITGGTISNTVSGNTDPSAIYNTTYGGINISGGAVSALTGKAIYNNNNTGAIKITGGLVRATTGKAVQATNAATALTVGGTAALFAYGSNIGDVISHTGYTAPTGDGVVVAWNNAAGHIEYNLGTDDDIFAQPTGIASWGLAGVGGISYVNGSNAGFIDIPGVTVTGVAECEGGPAIASTINAYGTGGGTGGALNAVWNAETSTVTVTNTGGTPITGANQTLSLNLDECVKVLWTASLSGGTTAEWASLVYIEGSGVFEIPTGGLISQTGSGLYKIALTNENTASIIISGGILSALGGPALVNNATGLITISGSTSLITSACTTNAHGTIYLVNDLLSHTDPILIITGGTVENTATVTGFASSAIYNATFGAVNISGGTVSSTAGCMAIRNTKNGVINISEPDKTNNPVLITSTCTDIGGGTIYLDWTFEQPGTRLIMTGGTVENMAQSDNGFAIHNNSLGEAKIMGGTVKSLNGAAIRIDRPGAVIISEVDGVNHPTLITSYTSNYGRGTICTESNSQNSTGVRIIIEGGIIENTSTNVDNWVLRNECISDVIISGGTIRSEFGGAIFNTRNGLITISETDKINHPTLITGSSINAYSGIIYLNDIADVNGPILIIKGGTIKNMAANKDANVIINRSIGSIDISGGALIAGKGTVINNQSKSIVNISEFDKVNHPTLLTCANEDEYRATILMYNNGAGGITSPRLIMTGGTVENTSTNSDSRAIRSEMSGSINISGGTVRADKGTAILYAPEGGAINISELDGETQPTLITSACDNSGTILINWDFNGGAETALNVLGGKVENTSANANASAIRNESQRYGMNISGGLITAKNGKAIYNHNTWGDLLFAYGSVNITGGIMRAQSGYAYYDDRPYSTLTLGGTATLFAYGNNTAAVFSHHSVTTPSADGVVIAWNQAAGNTEYDLGTDEDIITQPAGVALWDFINVGGISYVNGNNAGFIDIPEVTVITGIPDCDGAALAAIINAYATGGGTGGALNALWNAENNTITVTNTGNTPITGANQTLTLNIDECLTVIWNASLSGATTTNWSSLVQIEGEGVFEIPEGGLINQTGNGSYKVALTNQNNTSINISGGVLRTLDGPALTNNATGLITIGGNTSLLTSACTSNAHGTIYLVNELPSYSEPILIIAGGTVENTASNSDSWVIRHNAAGGDAIITGGTIISESGRAILHSSQAVFTISEEDKINHPTMITGFNASQFNGVIQSSYTGGFIIAGGTIENTCNTTDGCLVCNKSVGAVTITGGTLLGGSGIVINNEKSGLITISEPDKSNPVLLTCSNSDAAGGAILFYNNYDYSTASRLNMTGGTIENISGNTNARTIRNESAGALNISGGTIRADKGVALYNVPAANVPNVINISETDSENDPTLITSSCEDANRSTLFLDTFFADNTNVVLNITGGTVENTSANANTAAIRNNTNRLGISIRGGLISATGGKAVYNYRNFPQDPGGGYQYGSVEIIGGTLRAKSGYAYYDERQFSELTLGGTATLFAYGSNTAAVFSHHSVATPSADGVVIAWNQAAGNTEYIFGTQTDIVSMPTGVASWNFIGVGGIGYVKGNNIGFIDIPEVTVNAAGVPPTIITTTLPSGIVGVPYNTTLVASGETPIIWSVESGNLPTGVSLSPAGVISGTPEEDGGFSIIVKAENIAGNDTQALTLTVVLQNPPVITTGNLPNGVVGTAYSVTLEATGDQPIIWTINPGNILPAGLTLSEEGLISGTPTENGLTFFTVRSENDGGFDEKEFSILVVDCTIAVTLPYEESFEDVDNGLNFPECWTQEIGGNPDKWQIRTTGYPNCPGGGSHEAFIWGNNAVTKLVTPKLDITGAENPVLSFWYVLQASGGAQDQLHVYYKNSAAGNWNLLASYTTNSYPWVEEIIFLPNPSDDYYIAFEGQTHLGTGPRIDLIKIEEYAGAPIITTDLLPDGTLGIAYEATLEAIGTEPITWAVEGNLPTGLTLNSSTGVISGTPSVANTFNFTIKATNLLGTDEKEFTIEIIDVSYPPVINPIAEVVASDVKITWGAPEEATAQNYTIYRLKQSDPENLWTMLADHITDLSYLDTDWSTLPAGFYQWAIKANYATGQSEAALTNTLEKELSINDKHLTNILLYPNPFTNEIHINHPELVKSIQITDIVGQVVKTVVFNGKSIFAEELPAGIYFVTIEDFNGKKFTHKMVKNLK